MNMSEKYLFEHTKTVHHFHAGPTGLATMSALCRFAQESAGCHARRLGFGSLSLASAEHRLGTAGADHGCATVSGTGRNPPDPAPGRRRAERMSSAIATTAILDRERAISWPWGRVRGSDVDLARPVRPCKAESFFSRSPGTFCPPRPSTGPLPGNRGARPGGRRPSNPHGQEPATWTLSGI